MRKQLCKDRMGEDWPKSSRAEKKLRVIVNASQHRHEALKRELCSPGVVKITKRESEEQRSEV